MMNRAIYLAVLVLMGLIIGIFISRYDLHTTLRATPKLSQEERDATLKELQGYKDQSGQFVKLVKLVRPSVVSISTKKTFRGFIDDFFWGMIPREYESSQVGSGLIVDNKGYILTNNHVVQGVDEIKVTLDDGREFTGKVIGGDTLSDIAVVKIAADGLQPAILGDSDKIEVGEMVMAIGSPFGLGQTVTSGIISARRNIPTASAKGGGTITADYPDFIQTDAAINPGNSGGPLVSLNGEVIGINSIILTRGGGYQGIGFAIPINRAKYIMEQLIAKGKVTRPFLGVEESSSINEALAEKYGFGSVDEFLKELQIDKPDGVFVVKVIPDSPAAESKLREGDLILEYKDQKVNTPDELVKLINKSEVGEEVTLKTLRNGKQRIVKVTIRERK